jgi:hypothetical protein
VVVWDRKEIRKGIVRRDFQWAQGNLLGLTNIFVVLATVMFSSV